MSKQQDNRRARARRAAKTERVYSASKFVSVFNSATSIGADGEVTHRAERACQTIRIVEIDANGTRTIIQEVFTRIDRIDVGRMQTLLQATEQHVNTYNQLEIEKTMAAPSERIRI